MSVAFTPLRHVSTPLCPAGHLPLKGGDDTFIDVRHQSQTLKDKDRSSCQPISPLEGEMPGRAEGGIPAHSSDRGTNQ
ncbi:lytic murein transglycosylase [Phyllobacterium salinisoli]|uniref:Lytic murein transglycosylase n=1 Tax=Phyllobacterium salinisoli TaxID=1899321 RepID=A0A368K6X4_9HYPH|nr:lytic murein transglycosylase [Phyllobacterium salinisoli]